MAYTIDRFGSTYGGGVALPQHVATQPWGSGTAPSFMVDLPGGGSWDYQGDASAKIRWQPITITGTWVAASAAAMQTKMDALNALKGVRNYLWASNDSGTTTRSKLARCTAVRATLTPTNTTWVGIEMDFDLYAGPWRGAVHSETTLLATGSDNISTTNGGNTRVHDAVLTITAITTAITALNAYKANRLHWHYSGTITAATSLVINCGTKQVLNNGVDDYANFTLQGNHPLADWHVIDSGAYTFLIERTGGAVTSTINLDYYDGWY